MATLKVVFKAIDEISSKFNEMTQSGERALEAFENTGTAADGALSKVSRTAAQTAKSTDAAADSVDDLSSAIGDYEKATGQAANSTGVLSEKTTETEKNLDEAAEAARKASDEVEKFGDKSEETGKQSEESSKKSRDGIKELQGVLASAGIAATLNEIKNGFFDCSEAAAQFETSTAMVATIADTSQKSLSSISKEVRSYSNETGEAASDMAEATYQAISAGINTADAAAFAGTATKLAVGGFTSATTAVDVLTTAINAYGLAASDATQLSDYLITTQNLGKTSVDQLAQSVGKVIPLASAYNVQMDNLSSAYAVLTANGIATAESGTYLKSMLNELGDTGSGVSEVLLNSTGKTFAQLMEQGYSLGDVMAMLGNAVDGDSTAFNALWNSTEAVIGALSLFNAGADKYNSVLESMRTSAGATEKAYSTMADTTDKSKQRMENAFNNLKISVGDVLNPALTQVYEGFTNVFAGMSDFVDEHPAVVAAISAIAVGVGGFTGALAAYNLATTAAKFVTEAFTATLAANPYVLAAAGIVAVTAAAVTLTGALITQSDEFEANQQTLSDIEGEWRGVAQAVEDSQNQTVSYEEAVSAAVSTAQTELDNLTAAYDKAYESARTSIEGQIGLFDTMKTSSELSISDMEKAMQSQTDYLNLYSENLKKAAEYGLDDGLIKSLSDGSEESAGYINAIIQNIEKLGGSTEGMPAAASKFVTEFNSKFEETEKAKDTFADNVAKMETDFDEKMGEIETRMSKTVQNMEMTDEARKAAQDTIKAYCDAIRSMTGEAGSAAEAVANAAASHLKTAPTTTPTTTTVTGHANGTLSAQEDVYIAGEKGPELIIGARGSEVFPTQETERILAAVNSAENATNAPEPTASPLPENDLPEGMEAVKEYSYLTADGQGSDAQPTGIEYVEPEVQAQTTEEAAPAEEAPVNTTAPAASDAQQEAPASSSDAPSIGETVKRIILEINGSGSIDVGGMNEESVLDILTRHAKPVLMSIIKGEIFEEGDLAYDF